MGKMIKIARIGGEFIDKNDDVVEYLNPFTGFAHNHWFEFEHGKKIFDSLRFKHILIDCNALSESDVTSDEMAEREIEILTNNYSGFKPTIYLFSFEISEHIWNNKEKLAKESGFDEDEVMEFITMHTEYSWNTEATREIKIPKKNLTLFDDFMWIQENFDALQIKYMQFLVETGGDDDINQDSFNMMMAREGREIIELGM